MRLKHIVIGALALHSVDLAYAEPTIAFGNAIPGQSIEQIIASMPGAHWGKVTDSASGALVGALSSLSVKFDGWLWNLHLGKLSPLATEFAYSFDLNSDRQFQRADQCVTTVSHIIQILEPQLGAYTAGTWRDVYPSWTTFEKRGGPPRQAAAGKVSAVNVYDNGEPQHISGLETQFIIGIRPVKLGAATLASVVGKNTRAKTLDGKITYFCSISIAFKTPS